MIHHDGRPYNVAVKKGREKMETIINNGIKGATSVIEQVQNRIVQDRIVKGKALEFRTLQGNPRMVTNEFDMSLHNFAWSQVLSRAEIPERFANNLREKDWGKELLTHNLNTIYHNEDSRFLVRSTNNEVRGFLSDRFRRLDSRPLLESFVQACQTLNLQPIDGFAMDTQVRLRAVLPEVFEPIPDEPLLFGLEWKNSDFGHGGHGVSLWTMRVWCTNLAIGEECLRQVHLGKRLDDNIEYSQETYRLDTAANASALKDVVHNSISPERVNAYLEVIQKASREEIQGRDGALSRLKKLLDKSTAEKVADAFASHDIVNMPAGNNLYRLSNAVSWIAQAKEFKPERRMELEEVAGWLLPKPVKGELVQV